MPVGIRNSNTIGGKKIIKKISKPKAKPMVKPVAKTKKGGGLKERIADLKKSVNTIFSKKVVDIDNDDHLAIMKTISGVVATNYNELRKILEKNEEIKILKIELNKILLDHHTHDINSTYYDNYILDALILCILSNKLERLMVSIFASGAEPYETELEKIKGELYNNILPDVKYDYAGPSKFKELYTIPEEVYPYYDFNDFKTTFKKLLTDNGLDINKINETYILLRFRRNIEYFYNVLGVDKIINDLGIAGEVLKRIKSGKKDDGYDDDDDDDDDDNFLNFDDHMNKLFYLFRYYIGKDDFKWSTIFFIIDVMNQNILKELQAIYEKPFVSDYNTNDIKLKELKGRIASIRVTHQTEEETRQTENKTRQSRLRPLPPLINQVGEKLGGAKKKKDSKVVAKRVPTPYNKFVKKHFPELKKKFPNDKAPEIMKKIAIEWKKTKK
jgi:hypothetical protein